VQTERIDFTGGGEFAADIKARVRRLLDDPVRVRRAERRMYLKTGITVAWLVASWTLLVFFADAFWQAAVLSVLVGLALAGLGFNVTHDANHGAYSRRRNVNRAMRWSMDVIGASSYVWRVKHNVVHHTYTNIAGADQDIEAMPFARFAPEQPRRFFHRLQHVYIWVLYGLFAIQWHTFGDFKQLISGRIGDTAIRWPRGGELAGFIAGKLAFVAWTLAIPMLFHPPLHVLAAFAVASFVLALVLSVVFQLAHCLEEADFPSSGAMRDGGRTEWARHQVETTVDFAPGNRFLTWYLGGLNYQVEHHLFSRVSHLHYPALAEEVRAACETHGVRYQVHPTLWSALASHTRWLRRMGRPEPRAGTTLEAASGCSPAPLDPRARPGVRPGGAVAVRAGQRHPEQDHPRRKPQVKPVVGVVDRDEVHVAVAIDEEPEHQHQEVGDAAPDEVGPRLGRGGRQRDADGEEEVDDVVEHIDLEDAEQLGAFVPGEAQVVVIRGDAGDEAGDPDQ
jgi:linoleoyl-CoA desaturase